MQLVAVHLVDSHYCSDPGKFISVLLTSLSTMVQVELPHVNILSKVDLMEQYGKLGEVYILLLFVGPCSAVSTRKASCIPGRPSDLCHDIIPAWYSCSLVRMVWKKSSPPPLRLSMRLISLAPRPAHLKWREKAWEHLSEQA